MSPISLDKTYRFSDDVVVRDIDGEIIIVPLTAGIGDMEDELYTLNATGRAICDRLDGKRSLREMAKEISQEFDAGLEEIEADMAGFLEELLKRGMLVEAAGA